jgi:hypothetical protein
MLFGIEEQAFTDDTKLPPTSRDKKGRRTTPNIMRVMNRFRNINQRRKRK